MLKSSRVVSFNLVTFLSGHHVGKVDAPNSGLVAPLLRRGYLKRQLGQFSLSQSDQEQFAAQIDDVDDGQERKIQLRRAGRFSEQRVWVAVAISFHFISLAHLLLCLQNSHLNHNFVRSIHQNYWVGGFAHAKADRDQFSVLVLYVEDLLVTTSNLVRATPNEQR